LINLSTPSAYAADYTWYLYERLICILFYLPVLAMIILYYGKKFILHLKKILRGSSGLKPIDSRN